jgi:Relaxase/Mobilisation nuclease domain
MSARGDRAVSRTVINGSGTALLDVVSYGRRGPGRRDRLPQTQVALIARTVNRTPEVMVKVLTHGAHDLRAAARHLSYLTRDGDLDLETDDGEQVTGKRSGKTVLDDWDLDLDQLRQSARLIPGGDGRPAKLIHKLIFSMPVGTPAPKVLEAVRTFAREEFALKHRYALVLHTDEPHPHVHMVVKAMGEDGKRLNIKKETLRTWRREFARRLREQGIEANATDRSARGVTRVPKIDGIFRANERGVSTHYYERESVVRRELATGGLRPEPARERLKATRRDLLQGWAEIAETLDAQREPELAAAVRQFAKTLPPPLTEKERLAAELETGHSGKPEDPERER